MRTKLILDWHVFITVISEPDDITVCEGEEAVFTCILDTTNNNINSDDVQWYRLVKDTGITISKTAISILPLLLLTIH